MFRDRQSSLIGRSRPAISAFGGCGHTGPKLFATRTPAHGSGGWGGRQRNAPTGAAAYGMPRKTVSERSRPAMPSTSPDSVSTGKRMKVLTFGSVAAEQQRPPGGRDVVVHGGDGRGGVAGDDRQQDGLVLLERAV